MCAASAVMALHSRLVGTIGTYSSQPGYTRINTSATGSPMVSTSAIHSFMPKTSVGQMRR